MEQPSGEVIEQQSTSSPAKRIVLAICLLALAGGGSVGYRFWKQHQTKVKEQFRRAFLQSMDKRLRDQVARELYDPDSAKFKNSNLFFTPAVPGQDKDSQFGTYALCGSINAKNTYGGYVGYTLFFSMVQTTHNRPDKEDSSILVSNDHMGAKELQEDIRVLQLSRDNCYAKGTDVDIERASP